ncbi:MAG: fused MFS/spermidine synthase [Terriglobia bacterium]
MSSSTPRSSAPLILRLLPLLFFFSGASSLIFETIFTRLLTYTFGNTAYAVSTVLAAFLGGLALGAYVLGRYADRRPPSVWIYGALELLVGVYALFIPKLFSLLTQTYVAIYRNFNVGSAPLTAIRFALASIVILAPTILMGGTLPVLARFVASGRPVFHPQVCRLYTWNTFGAAMGTLGSAYLLMPWLGVWGTIGVACSINFALFISVTALSGLAETAPSQESVFSPPASSIEDTATRTPAVYPIGLILLTAFVTGLIALAYEVLWTHVLSFLIGNTVYAFGVMLFTFLCGLGWGAHIVASRLPHPRSWPWAMSASQLALGLVIYLSLPLWNRIPDLFAGGLLRALEIDIVGVAFLIVCRMALCGWAIYRRPLGTILPWRRVLELVFETLLLFVLLNVKTNFLWKYEATYFITGELLHFLCSFILLIVPSLLLGISFPLLLNLSSGAAGPVGKSVGSVYAANTVGAIFGSVITGFILLPRFGSFTSSHIAATANLTLGLWIALMWVPLSQSRKFALAVITVSLGVIFWAGPGGWDARNMTRGSYVYFTEGWPIDRVLYFKEDVQGGLTSVVQIGSTHMMLTNGKFQGDNTGEVGEQIRIAMIPMLFTRSFDKALVIGLGTGNTLRAISRFPFRSIDAIELAPRIVDAARDWFEDINERVFDRDPRVKLSIADGRNFLLLSQEHYDLITIEVSSIWISGEADLYNKEFYELCRTHLTDQGVLQQWVQIHHMRTEDFLVILNTAARVFPHVAFFLGPEQGVLIASVSPLTVDYNHIQAFDADPRIQTEMKVLDIRSTATLLGELMLEGESMKRALSFLPSLSRLPADFASTDFYPYLEYQTPKGNTLPYDTVPVNTQFMESLRPPPLPPDLPIINLPSLDERNLFDGFVTEGRGDQAGAAKIFRRVQGSSRVRALAEVSRIESAAQQGTRH